MNKLLTIAVVVAVAWIGVASDVAAQTQMLAGWYDFMPDNSLGPFSPDVALTGVDASVGAGMISQDTWSSTDGTYGTFSSGASGSGSGCLRQRTDAASEAQRDVTITNNTGSALTLETFHFDVGRVVSTAPDDVALEYLSGNLSDPDGTAINSATGLTGLTDTNEADWGDFDWSLSVLSDQVLANGESATFRLTFSNASNPSQALGLDNIAISGSVAAATPGTLIYGK